MEISASHVVKIAYHVSMVLKTVKCAARIPFEQDLVHVNVTKAFSMTKRANHACVNPELSLTKIQNNVNNALCFVKNAVI